MVQQMEHVVTAHAEGQRLLLLSTSFRWLTAAYNYLQRSKPFSGPQGHLPAFTQAHTHTQTHMHTHIIKKKS